MPQFATAGRYYRLNCKYYRQAIELEIFINYNALEIKKSFSEYL